MPTATKKRTGDTAQTSVTVALAITGTLASTTAVTALSSVVGLAVGQKIGGTGIPAGTTITALNSSAMSLTLSQAATASAANVALSVSGETQIIGLMDWSISWKTKTVEATTTDDASYESSLPSTASWTVKAKYIYLMGDASQTALVRSILSNPQTSTQTWNFFATDQAGDDAFTGQAYIDGLDFDGAGTGKIFGMGVSLKGSGPLAITPGLAPITNPNTITGLQAED